MNDGKDFWLAFLACLAVLMILMIITYASAANTSSTTTAPQPPIPKAGPLAQPRSPRTGESFGRPDAGLKARLFFMLLQTIMSLVILGIVSPGAITRAAANKM